MKGFVTVISFLLFVLCFAKAEYMDVAATVTPLNVCVVQDANPVSRHSMDCVVPIESDRGIDGLEFGDSHSLAHRISISAERVHRFSSTETTQFIKNLLRKMATRMTTLANCHTRMYDFSRHLNWDTACEHYVIAMRRILI
ncbi:MAG: hypothetical protein K2I55_09855 [Phocaeicola sp.]|nr:hypothetical protein [Phocaeicola sp.]